MLKNTPIVFRVDQGDYHPVFSLRKLFVSDDSKFLQRFIDLADDEDRSESLYKAKVAAISEWAHPWPDDLKDEKGKKIKRPAEALDSAESIEQFFADGDADKDWIVDEIVTTLRRSPRLTFFGGSGL